MQENRISRREFLRRLVIGAGGVGLAACDPNPRTPENPTFGAPTPVILPSKGPVTPESTATPLATAQDAMATSTATPESSSTPEPTANQDLPAYQPAIMLGSGGEREGGPIPKDLILDLQNKVVQDLISKGYLPLLDRSETSNKIGILVDEGLGTEHYRLPVMTSFAGLDLNTNRGMTQDGVAVYGDPAVWTYSNWIGRLVDGSSFVGSFLAPQQVNEEGITTRPIEYWFEDAEGNPWMLPGQQRQAIYGTPINVDAHTLIVKAAGYTFNASRPTERPRDVYSTFDINGVFQGLIDGSLVSEMAIQVESLQLPGSNEIVQAQGLVIDQKTIIFDGRTNSEVYKEVDENGIKLASDYIQAVRADLIKPDRIYPVSINEATKFVFITVDPEVAQRYSTTGVQGDIQDIGVRVHNIGESNEYWDLGYLYVFLHFQPETNILTFTFANMDVPMARDGAREFVITYSLTLLHNIQNKMERMGNFVPMSSNNRIISSAYTSENNKYVFKKDWLMD